MAFSSSLLSSEVAAFQARAKARKENGQVDEAVEDLTSALKLSPNNRDIRRLLIKLKEEAQMKTKHNEKNMGENNNYELGQTELGNGDEKIPVGATLSRSLKYLDDSASQKSEGSSITYQANSRRKTYNFIR